MIVLAWSLAAVLLVLAVLAAVSTRVGALAPVLRPGVYVAEALVVVFVVADVAAVLGAPEADRPDSLVTHLGYALAAVGLVPMLVLRPEAPGEEEAEPASPWVVAVALLAVAVCVVRLAQTR